MSSSKTADDGDLGRSKSTSRQIHRSPGDLDDILKHISEGNFTKNTETSITEISLKCIDLNFHSNLPEANELNSYRCCGEPQAWCWLWIIVDQMSSSKMADDGDLGRSQGTSRLTHWSPGDPDAILKTQFSILYYWLVSSDLLMISPSDECHGTSLMRSKLWFR